MQYFMKVGKWLVRMHGFQSSFITFARIVLMTVKGNILTSKSEVI